MPKFTANINVGVYCTCGTPLEQFGESGLNWITVKPCPACCQVKRIEEREKQINRRGVLVGERST